MNEAAQAPGSSASFRYQPGSYVQADHSTFNDISGNGRQIITNIDGDGAVVHYYGNHDVPRERERERVEFEDWLSPLNFRETHNDIYAKRQDGTGDWIFREQDFEDWLQGEYRTLWCSGIPGSGKTVLASHIIDRLKQLHGTSTDVAVLFIYCNYKERTTHSVYNLVANILKQLVQGFPHISDRVRQKFHSHRQQRFRPIVRDICDVLIEEIKRFSNVFIIADALDEVTEDRDRLSLLEGLQSLKAQLLVTSRDIESIGEALDNARRLHIRARDEDLKMFINNSIRPGLRLHTIVKDNTQLREEIVSTIIKHTGGMFLLCHLDVLLLESKSTQTHIRLALQDLPKGVDSAYDGTMDRIYALSEHDRTLALWIITWITYALRPLLIKELQYILAFSFGTQNIVEEDLMDKSLMTSMCIGLIAYDEEYSVFRLVHYTAQEYLNKHPERLFPNPHEHLTRISLQILSLPSTANSFNDNLALYAAQYWGCHALGDVEESLESEIQHFLSSKEKVQVALSHLHDGVQYQSGGSALHLCAFFGLVSTLQRSLRYYPGSHKPVSSLSDETDEPLSVIAFDFPANVTPLFFAATNGHVKAVQVLLDVSGADINSKNVLANTPLIAAGGHGKLEIVKLLLARGNIDVNATNVHGHPALSYAAQRGQVDVVELLLAREEINVNLAGNDGRTALYVAAGSGQTEVVKLLLARDDIDVNITAVHGYTPFAIAVQEGKVDTVKLLLERLDIDVNKGNLDGFTPLYFATVLESGQIIKLLLARDDIIVNGIATNGHSPLSCAVQGGRLDIVTLLLARDDIDVNLAEDGFTPLYVAAGCGQTDIVRLLLARNDIDVSSTTKSGHTPLSYAAQEGHLEVVRLLLAREDIDENLPSDDGRIPLYTAAGRGHLEVVKLLLARDNVKVNSTTKRGHTPLSYAAEQGKADVVKLLLKREDINANMAVKGGVTPLHIASGKGHTEVVKLFLSRNDIDVNLKTMRGHTPLFYASETGQVEIVKLFLAMERIDVNLAAIRGWTPLFVASGNGQTKVVNLLLATDGININPTTIEGYTPLIYAAQEGRVEVVEELLRKGVDINLTSSHNRTALHYAADWGRGEVVKLQLATDNVEINSATVSGSTPLSYASAARPKEGRGDFAEVVKLLLERDDIDVNSKSIHNWTPLSCAAGKGNVEVVRLLLGNPGVDVNAKNVVGMTPLLLAALRGHEEVVKALLGRSDIAVDGVNPANGRSILHLAAGKGWSDIVESLVTNGLMNSNLKDTLGRTPLAIAVGKGHLPIIRQLLPGQGVDVNGRDKEGKTLLIMAAEHGHDLVIQELLAANDVDVNQPDHNEDTPLHFAVRFEHRTIVHILLQHQNIAPNARNSKGYTPIHCAIERLGSADDWFFHGSCDTPEDLDIIKLLLAQDVRIDIGDKDGVTALELARSMNLTHVVSLLEQHLVGSAPDPLGGWPSQAPDFDSCNNPSTLDDSSEETDWYSATDSN